MPMSAFGFRVVGESEVSTMGLEDVGVAYEDETAPTGSRPLPVIGRGGGRRISRDKGRNRSDFIIVYFYIVVALRQRGFDGSDCLYTVFIL